MQLNFNYTGLKKKYRKLLLFKISKRNVGNKTMKNMAQKYELSWEKHLLIKKYCEKKKIKY